jgi:hypothetical protein
MNAAIAELAGTDLLATLHMVNINARIQAP